MSPVQASTRSLMARIEEEICGIATLRFTVQRGATLDLTAEDISAKFARLGHTVTATLTSRYKTSGLITFSSVAEARRSRNMVVEVAGCLIHIHLDSFDLSPFPSRHQVLVESVQLAATYEKNSILRNFFETFGEVTGVMFTGIIFKQMAVVSFRKNIASDLTGRLVQVRVVGGGGAGALERRACARQGGLLPHHWPQEQVPGRRQVRISRVILDKLALIRENNDQCFSFKLNNVRLLFKLPGASC